MRDTITPVGAKAPTLEWRGPFRDQDSDVRVVRPTPDVALTLGYVRAWNQWRLTCQVGLDADEVKRTWIFEDRDVVSSNDESATWAAAQAHAETLVATYFAAVTARMTAAMPRLTSDTKD